jgi:hypothetical protein
MNSREQVASRLLDSINESLSVEPDTLARVEGQQSGLSRPARRQGGVLSRME